MVRGVSSAAPVHGAGQNTVAPLTAIRKRAQKVSSLWIFDSPKNNRRMTVSGDVAFLHLVLLEGDPRVSGYDLVDDPFKITSNSEQGYVRLRLDDGSEQWLTVGRYRVRGEADAPHARPTEALRAKANDVGVQLIHRTELDLAGRDLLLDNWLTLCAIMTRARGFPCHFETERFLSCFSRHDALPVASLLTLSDIDRGLMLNVVARALQSGHYTADLERSLFGPNSVLRKGRP